MHAGLNDHVNSDTAEQHQHDNDDENRADHANAAVAIAIAVTAEAATESAEQEDHKKDDKDESERHNFFLRSTLQKYFLPNGAPPCSPSGMTANPGGTFSRHASFAFSAMLSAMRSADNRCR
jgi:hypothetical protein